MSQLMYDLIVGPQAPIASSLPETGFANRVNSKISQGWIFSGWSSTWDLSKDIPVLLLVGLMQRDLDEPDNIDPRVFDVIICPASHEKPELSFIGRLNAKMKEGWALSGWNSTWDDYQESLLIIGILQTVPGQDKDEQSDSPKIDTDMVDTEKPNKDLHAPNGKLPDAK